MGKPRPKFAILPSEIVGCGQYTPVIRTHFRENWHHVNKSNFSAVAPIIGAIVIRIFLQYWVRSYIYLRGYIGQVLFWSLCRWRTEYTKVMCISAVDPVVTGPGLVVTDEIHY